MAVNIKRYIKIWQITARMQALQLLSKPIAMIGFTAGKFLRMAFFLIFGIALFQNTSHIAGFSRGELLVCSAFMNLIDVLSQMIFLRGLNSLQWWVKNGKFDALLVQPISSLFWISVFRFDWLDFITLPGALYYLWFAAHALEYTPRATSIALACGMVFVGCAIAYAMMLAISAMTFYTEETENAWWLYRDFLYAARNPPTVFPRAVQFAFTFFVPIFTIVSFPAYALIGRLSGWFVAWGCIAAALSLTLALYLWRRGVRRYSSASS